MKKKYTCDALTSLKQDIHKGSTYVKFCLPVAVNTLFNSKKTKLLIRFRKQLQFVVKITHITLCSLNSKYFSVKVYCACTRGADKSLARPGRKQARKHVRDARDFNKIEPRAVIKVFFSARQGAEGNSRHFDRNISLFPSWSV